MQKIFGLGALGALSNGLGALSTALAALSTGLAALFTGLGALPTGLGVLSSSLDALSTSLGALSIGLGPSIWPCPKIEEIQGLVFTYLLDQRGANFIKLLKHQNNDDSENHLANPNLFVRFLLSKEE